MEALIKFGLPNGARRDSASVPQPLAAWLGSGCEPKEGTLASNRNAFVR